MPESNLTKKAIALSAKELTKEKPYDKISISDIADRCGIKRQTFYYHFQDKYELLVWIYFNELFAPNMEGISLENWDEKLGAILTQMQEEKKFYINTIKHAEDYIIQYMLEVAEQTFEEAIDKLDEKSHDVPFFHPHPAPDKGLHLQPSPLCEDGSWRQPFSVHAPVHG